MPHSAELTTTVWSEGRKTGSGCLREILRHFVPQNDRVWRTFIALRCHPEERAGVRDEGSPFWRFSRIEILKFSYFFCQTEICQV